MGEFNEHDPRVVESWWSGARAEVGAYLLNAGVRHGEVALRPAWCVAPYVSVWAAERVPGSGWVGWWVVYGNLPTDHVSAGGIRDPRSALEVVGERWLQRIEAARGGELPADPRVREALATPQLDRIENRARTISEWARDDELWGTIAA